MRNEYYWRLAQRAADVANEGRSGNILPEYVYSQWKHETNGFTSELLRDNNNLGGLTQVEPNDTPQPDGDYFYKKFASQEECAEYVGRYLRLYDENGIFEASTLEEYCAALKRGYYFGDTLENYTENCLARYAEDFGEGA